MDELSELEKAKDTDLCPTSEVCCSPSMFSELFSPGKAMPSCSLLLGGVPRCHSLGAPMIPGKVYQVSRGSSALSIPVHNHLTLVDLNAEHESRSKVKDKQEIDGDMAPCPVAAQAK